MSKIDALKKQISDACGRREELAQKVNALSMKRDSAKADAEAYAARGDLDLYVKAKQEVSRLDDEVFVAQKQLETARNPIKAEEAAAAWEEYRKGADKRLQAAWKAYLKQRDALASQLAACMDLMASSLRERENLAETVAPNNHEEAKKLLFNYGLFTINAPDVSNDLVFLRRSGYLQRETDGVYNLMVNSQTTDTKWIL